MKLSDNELGRLVDLVNHLQMAIVSYDDSVVTLEPSPEVETLRNSAEQVHEFLIHKLTRP